MGADLVRRLRVGLGGSSWEEVDVTDLIETLRKCKCRHRKKKVQDKREGYAILCVAAGANESYERLVAAHPGKFRAFQSQYVGRYGRIYQGKHDDCNCEDCYDAWPFFRCLLCVWFNGGGSAMHLSDGAEDNNSGRDGCSLKHIEVCWMRCASCVCDALCFGKRGRESWRVGEAQEGRSAAFIVSRCKFWCVLSFPSFVVALVFGGSNLRYPTARNEIRSTPTSTSILSRYFDTG
eukprot:2394130-Rhodomonas_salina.2